MESRKPWYVTYTWILAGLILTVYTMIVAKPILLPLLFAGFFSILLTPLCERLEGYKIPRIIAAMIAILLATLFLFGLGFFFYSQASEFVQDIDFIQRRIEELIRGLEDFLVAWFGMERFDELETLESRIFDYMRENAAALTLQVAGAATTITAIFLIPIYMFLMLIFRDFLQEFFLQLFGRSDQELRRMKKILEKVKYVVQQYITGVLIVILILAVLNSLMLWLVGVNHAIFFGVFAAMLNVIPFIGPIFGSILPTMYALLTMDSLLYPVIIILSFYVIQLFESNLFTPVIVGSKVSMNALMTLLLLFVGAQIWGLAGMILFIPLGAILKVVFDEIDSLKPYGFLLGRVPNELHKKKGPLARRISQIGQGDGGTSGDSG